jgi:hypothetical protein
MPESRISLPSAVLRGAVLLAAGIGTYWSIRIAWADHLSMGNGLAERQRAVELLPSATFYERLADKREESGGNSLPDLECAASLDPVNAGLWLRLGLRAEFSGDLTLAEHSLLAGAARSRLYLPRYSLAGYYFRRKNADEFRRWSREALRTAYGDVAPLLDLCWRMRPEPDWLARQALSERPEIARQFLMLLMQHRELEAAGNLASAMVPRALREDLPWLLAYCDLSLSEGRSPLPVRIWNGLCHRRLVPYGPLDPSRGHCITNPDFATPALRSGFEWHMDGASLLESVRFGRELRLTFAGRQPEKFVIAWQFIPVTPGVPYHLRWECTPIDGASCDGIAWRLYETRNALIPQDRAADGSISFATALEVLRLALVYERPAGSTKLQGTVAIKGLKLEPGP